MALELNRLLFTDEPRFDESFIGYIMRIAEINEISDIRWILSLARSGKFYKTDYKYNFDLRIDFTRLSNILGIEINKLKQLIYHHEFNQTKHITGNLILFNQPIAHDLVCRESPKICPKCLEEKNYCRRIWEIALVTTCPIHKCFLLDYCPKCLKKLDWSRPKINLCHCNFDFRQIKIFHLKEIELRLSKYLFKYFNLNTGQPEFTFSYPLKGLEFSRLLKLLLFVAAHFSRIKDLNGSYFFKSLSNKQLHENLVSALSVFENWAENYHIFIRDWHKYPQGIFLKRKPLDLWNPEDYSITYDYEIFNYVLYESFYGKQFAFLRREFENFLEKFIARDYPTQPSFFDDFE